MLSCQSASSTAHCRSSRAPPSASTWVPAAPRARRARLAPRGPPAARGARPPAAGAWRRGASAARGAAGACLVGPGRLAREHIVRSCFVPFASCSLALAGALEVRLQVCQVDPQVRHAAAARGSELAHSPTARALHRARTCAWPPAALAQRLGRARPPARPLSKHGAARIKRRRCGTVPHSPPPRISFVADRPLNYWHEFAPDEYGFWANINPNVSARRGRPRRRRRRRGLRSLCGRRLAGVGAPLERGALRTPVRARAQ